MNSGTTGKLGEKIACQFLEKKGYRILDKNFIFRFPYSPQKGEIDIVAKKGDTLVFVEVKTLRNSRFFSPEEKVNLGKIRKIIQCSEFWMVKHNFPFDTKRQIDIIAVEIKYGKTNISHFENVAKDFS